MLHGGTFVVSGHAHPDMDQVDRGGSIGSIVSDF